MLEINKKSHRQSRRRRERRSPWGVIRRGLFSIVIAVIVGAIVTVVYLAVTGKILNPPMSTTYIRRESTEAPVTPTPLTRPEVAIELFEMRTSPGKSVTLTARTSPEVDCTIKILYGPERKRVTSAGLEPRKSDAEGMVTWKWIVQPNMPAGKWPTTVTCGDPKNPGKIKRNLIVSSTPAN